MLTILDLLREDRIEPKRVDGRNGGEYHSPCPKCGGRDRFVSWPGQTTSVGGGTFWCRGGEKTGGNGCGIQGDAIQYLRDVRGMSYGDACAYLGLETGTIMTEIRMRPSVDVNQPAPVPAPRESLLPPELWSEKADALVRNCHHHLLSNGQVLEWLSSRGITVDMVKRHELGWFKGEKGRETYRPRSSWGLPREINPKTGKERMFRILPGLVIPFRWQGRVVKIKMREFGSEFGIQWPEDIRGQKYMPVKGSGRMYSIFGEPRRASLILETELDGVLAHELAGDVVTVMSTGSAQWSPDEHSEKILRACMRILNALDNDKAGIERTWQWWDKHYANHKRWPTPKRLGKDLGDAWQRGLDVRAWVKAGLPPVLLLDEPTPKPAAPAAAQPQAVETPAEQATSVQASITPTPGMLLAEVALRRLEDLEGHARVQSVREVLDEHPVWIATRLNESRELVSISVDCDPRWWVEHPDAGRVVAMIQNALDHEAVWEWVELQGGKTIKGSVKRKR